VLLLVAGCASSSLQLLHEPPPYLPELRSEYFTSNPDTPFRDDVNRGSIVNGMGRFEVLASWGHPQSRVSESAGQEKWTYFDVDDSGDALEYSLLFHDGQLERWTTRQVKNTGLAYRGKNEELTKAVPAALPPAGKRVPTN
jgi:hypothetical protein